METTRIDALSFVHYYDNGKSVVINETHKKKTLQDL